MLGRFTHLHTKIQKLVERLKKCILIFKGETIHQTQNK